MHNSATYLYRHFSKSNELLYVGISLSAVQRLSQHKDHSHWFSNISRVEIQHFLTRQEALDAEREAIQKEQPICNIQLKKTLKEIKKQEDIVSKDIRIKQVRNDFISKVVNYDISYPIDQVRILLGMSKNEIQSYIDSGKLSTFEVKGMSRTEKMKVRVSGWSFIDFIELLENKGKK